MVEDVRIDVVVVVVDEWGVVVGEVVVRGSVVGGATAVEGEWCV